MPPVGGRSRRSPTRSSGLASPRSPGSLPEDAEVADAPPSETPAGEPAGTRYVGGRRLRTF